MQVYDMLVWDGEMGILIYKIETASTWYRMLGDLTAGAKKLLLMSVRGIIVHTDLNVLL